MKNSQQFLLFILALIFLNSCEQSNSNIHQKETSIIRDSIPFELSVANNIIFKTVLNGVDSIDLFFDTGGTELVMLHESVKNNTTLLKDKNENYKEIDFDPLEDNNTLTLGNLSWDSLTIYPVGVGPLEADGHFGWDLFDNKIVELNYDKKVLVTHPSLPQSLDGYAKMEIEYSHTLFCIQGQINIDGKSYPNRYLFDTGFQRALLLDKDLRAESKFPTDLPVIKKSELRNSAGTVFVNQVVNAEQFCFKEICANNVPTQLFSTPNPARFETHILGNELLKRFNTIFDFQSDYVYLKPNTLMSLPYTDAS